MGPGEGGLTVFRVQASPAPAKGPARHVDRFGSGELVHRGVDDGLLTVGIIEDRGADGVLQRRPLTPPVRTPHRSERTEMGLLRMEHAGEVREV